MLKQEQIDRIQPNIRNIQIICLALIGGTIFFTVVACVIVDWAKFHTNFDSMLIMFAAGLGLLMAGKAAIIPGIIGNSMANSISEAGAKDELEQLANAYQSQKIIQFALLEGAALFNAIVIFLEQSAIALGMVALLVGLMATLIPRADSIYSWIEQQLN